MLNKPKFMSPSINMYGNSVIDLNSATLPFSCIVDGNEAVTDFQIVVSRLKDNVVVFDTGMRTLDKPFFPINNRNQNVVFSINIKDYFNAEAKTYYKPATNTYDETKTYYKLENSEYTASNPSSTNWSTNYTNYYYIDFVNSVDAYYWAITFKNSNSGTEIYSVAEVFYANDIPRVEILCDSGEGEYAPFSNNLVYNGYTLKYSVGWTAEGCSFENADEGYLRLTSGVDDDCSCHQSLVEAVSGMNDIKIVYCSAQVRGFKTNSQNSVPWCAIGFDPGGDFAGLEYLEKVHDSENINDGRWHTLSACYETVREGSLSFTFDEFGMGIKDANVGDIADFKDICVFNLTKIFGSGNEPSKEWCDKNLDSLRAAEIISKRCKFKAVYTQSQNIPIKKYGWRLTDVVSESVLMDTITKNQTYGIKEDISCVCNGLMNDTKYRLETYVETQNGYFDIVQSMVFCVNYSVELLEADFEIEPLNDTAGIMLNWGNLKTTEGVVVGNSVNFIETVPTVTSSSVQIPEDTSIVFSSISSSRDLEIDENSYVMISFQFDKSQDVKLFEMSGEDKYSNNMIRKLEYIQETNKFRYTVIKGDTLATCEKELTDAQSDLCWYVVTLCPMVDETVDFSVGLSLAQNVPYPLTDRYPSNELHPRIGDWGEPNVL